MLKYIILTEPDGAEFAFFCLNPTTHLELALSQQAYRPGRRIVSAGFVEFTYAVQRGASPDAGCQLVARTYGSSESLSLTPQISSGLRSRSRPAASLAMRRGRAQAPKASGVTPAFIASRWPPATVQAGRLVPGWQQPASGTPRGDHASASSRPRFGPPRRRPTSSTTPPRACTGSAKNGPPVRPDPR